MKKQTLNSIRVPLESWIYLQDQQALQRGGRHLTENHLEHLKNEMRKPYNKNGRQLMDGDLGGAIGEPKNSYEEGRWTSWSIEKMKQMLDEQNLPYIDAEMVEVINL